MTLRSLVTVFLVLLTACDDFPFLSRSGPTDGGADGGAGGRSGPSPDGPAPGQGGLFELGFGGPTSGLGMAGSDGLSNASDGVAIDGAGPDSFFVHPPWDVDGSSSLPFAIPAPATLPPASLTSSAVALAGGGGGIGGNGCGEPPTCYLRTIIATPGGKLYSASLSKAYPTDTCVTKTIDCDNVILVGDSNARYSERACSPDDPNITLGFLLPEYLAFGWQAGQVWESSNGFRSEWTLNNAGDDSGVYEPIPGQLSKLWPAWSRYFAGGEIYGELLVPLRQKDTHRFALGFALFDIRVRR